MNALRLVLEGRHEEVGVDGPVVGAGVRAELARSARGRADESQTKFPEPYAIARRMGLEVVELPALAAGVVAFPEQRVLLPHASRRDNGTRVFLAIAALVLAPGMPHTAADRALLALELAAPAVAVRELGVDAAALLQRDVALAVLVAWGRAVGARSPVFLTPDLLDPGR